LHGEYDGHIFRSLEVTQRSLGVTKGQKSKNFKIGQMTHQIEGNWTENRMQQFLAPPEVTQGQQRSPKVKNQKNLTYVKVPT